MQQIDRRSLLKSAAGIGILGLLSREFLSFSELRRGIGNYEGGYGPLTTKPAANTGEKLLALPEGFQYNAFGRTGDKMKDGFMTPSAHDGMAAFQVHDRIKLIRNHEVRDKPSASIAHADLSYDHTAGGGTTTLEVDPETRLLLNDHVSLSGTLVNCAGGPTPWGTWISCEETVAGTHEGSVYHLDKTVAKYGQNHGYCFEVPVSMESCAKAEPLKGLGRFIHEAIAVDPVTGIVYLTEDTHSAGFYRFIPNQPAKLSEGGRLQMLKIVDKPGFDTRKDQKSRVAMKAEWVNIADPDPQNATEKEAAVFEQGIAEGGATFGRLEGCWYGSGCIYMNSTDGGNVKMGQIWQYQPQGLQGGELTLLFESPGKEVLESPDNLCVSPRGGLVICEDGDGENFVRGLTVDGRLFDFAKNTLNDSEFAGSCFSPDGQTLFVNIQKPGITLAIWGPWNRGSF